MSKIEDLLVKLFESATTFYRVTSYQGGVVVFGFTQERNDSLMVDIETSRLSLIERLDFAKFNSSTEDFIPIIHKIMMLTKETQTSEDNDLVSELFKDVTGMDQYNVTYCDGDDLEINISTFDLDVHKRLISYDH